MPRSRSGDTKPVWAATFPDIACQDALPRHSRADVCVVGAGIAGLSVAYELSLQGKNVIVLDDGPIGGGETSRTTAHLVTALDDRFFRLERIHGLEKSRLAADSHRSAIERVQTIVSDEQIDCEFRRLDGYLFVPPGEDQGILDKELDAAHRAGLARVLKLSQAPIEDFDTGPVLRFPQQAQFDIGKYLDGLARSIKARGGKIHCGVHAESITGGSPATIVTSSGQMIVCDAVAVCTNTPVNDRVAVHTKQMPYRTYVIAARVAQASVTPALYWDTGDPYHYVRLLHGEGGDDLLIVGGEDHKTGQAEDAGERFQNLEKWARERWHGLGDVEYRWSGQVMEPEDGMAFIGRNPLDASNIFIATGDSGNGITHGVIAGMLISDLVLGKENPWEKLYDPKRIQLAASPEWVRENVNTFAQYADHLTLGDVDSVDNIPAGEGAIMRTGLKKIACFRDESGQLHSLSAVCPHLGAVVRWNAVEKTWDCPAHGSRFTASGEVVHGPANVSLSRVDTQDEKKAA